VLLPASFRTLKPPICALLGTAVLTYGLSSEYLKSTKEAEAKEKAPDADRSLYRCRHAAPGVLGARPHAASACCVPWTKCSSQRARP
jgi:hypothetical protein